MTPDGVTLTVTTHETYARLIELRDRAGGLIYERLTLADRLLSDRAWVEAPECGGGDESRAIDRLEEMAFADLCGALSLPEMLEILHHVPDEKTWKANRYNLRKMHREMKDRLRPPVPPAKGLAAVAAATATGNEKTALPEPTPRLPEPMAADETAALRRENADLHRRVQELTRSNERLTRTLERMRRMLSVPA